MVVSLTGFRQHFCSTSSLFSHFSPIDLTGLNGLTTQYLWALVKELVVYIDASI